MTALTDRIAGLKDLIELMDETIDKATRLTIGHFGESLDDRPTGDGWNLIDDLRSIRRYRAEDLADALEELSLLEDE
jgi:hypothetical protein